MRILEECTSKMKKRIDGLENFKVVFIIGNTGSGKSVLVNHLAGRTMKEV